MYMRQALASVTSEFPEVVQGGDGQQSHDQELPVLPLLQVNCSDVHKSKVPQNPD